jgi:hypothetical protein
MNTERITELEAQLEQLNKDINNFDIADYFDESDFQNELDNNSEEVAVLGYTYGAGYALRELDPVAFRQEYNNWLDAKDSKEVAEYNELIAERDEVEEELAEARDALEDEEEDA